MTAVQWWCSGVMLNRIFSSSTRRHQGANPMSSNVASKQNGLRHTPQKPSSESIGRAMDRVA
jgi:hypothetical protein